MAQENGLRFKLVYSHWYTQQGENFPIANGQPLETVKEMQEYIPDYMSSFIDSFLRNFYLDHTFQQGDSKYIFRHTLFLQYFLKRYSMNEVIISSEIVDDGSVYLYPIEAELFGINYLAGKNDYSIEQILLADQQLLDMLRVNKVKLFITNLIDPCLNYDAVKQVEKTLNSLGIASNNVIFMQGNNLREFNGLTNGIEMISGILSLHQAADLLINFPITAKLGYISDNVKIEDLDSSIRRPFKFISFNRSMNRSHRLALCYIAIKYNILNQGYFSFLNFLPNNIQDFLLDIYYDDEFFEIEEKIKQIVPLEIDTKHLSEQERESFSTVDCNFKDFYAETYVHITSETVFDDNVSQFFSEKTWRPIINLQPFIYVGNYKALEVLKSLGFKTFHPYIDESYDLEQDPKKRFLLIAREIKKLANKPLNEIHDWYYSITDILIHNQNHLQTFADYNPFDVLFNKDL
jgi:hypothetical protein